VSKAAPQKPGFFISLASLLILLLETRSIAIYIYMKYAVYIGQELSAKIQD